MENLPGSILQLSCVTLKQVLRSLNHCHTKRSLGWHQPSPAFFWYDTDNTLLSSKISSPPQRRPKVVRLIIWSCQNFVILTGFWRISGARCFVCARQVFLKVWRWQRFKDLFQHVTTHLIRPQQQGPYSCIHKTNRTLLFNVILPKICDKYIVLQSMTWKCFNYQLYGAVKNTKAKTNKH